MNIEMIDIKTIATPGMGSLSVFEAQRDIPFEVKRVYYTYGVPEGVLRGGHAHKTLKQLLFCPYGRITILLDDGEDKISVVLDTPAKGLVVENTIWREMLWDKQDSVLVVAASDYYKEDDYIRDYDEFLAVVRTLRGENAR